MHLPWTTSTTLHAKTNKRFDLTVILLISFVSLGTAGRLRAVD